MSRVSGPKKGWILLGAPVLFMVLVPLGWSWTVPAATSDFALAVVRTALMGAIIGGGSIATFSAFSAREPGLAISSVLVAIALGVAAWFLAPHLYAPALEASLLGLGSHVTAVAASVVLLPRSRKRR